MPIIGHAISPGLIGLVAINLLAKSFWRVLIFNGGSGSTGASEVRFKNKGNAKSGTSIGSGGTHANAFDADTSTNWTITGEFGEYVGLEFGGDAEIDEVDIVSLFNNASNTLIDYEVQFSDDGVTWTTLWSSFGNPIPTGNDQTTTSSRPFVTSDGAGLIHQRMFAVMGAAPEAMVNSQKAYAIHGAAPEAMVNSQKIYSIHGAAPEAMVNSIKVYAIYDSGS
jgi:hypothetical protein